MKNPMDNIDEMPLEPRGIYFNMYFLALTLAGEYLAFDEGLE